MSAPTCISLVAPHIRLFAITLLDLLAQLFQFSGVRLVARAP